MNLNQVKFLIDIATCIFLTSLQMEVDNLPLWEEVGMEFKAIDVNISPHMDPGLWWRKYQSQILDS